MIYTYWTHQRKIMANKTNKILAMRSVWDNKVPVVKTSKKLIDIYIQEALGEPFFYNEMIHVLLTAKRGTTIVIHLNTPGGLLDSALRIVDAIHNSKAVVRAHLTGSVASAGTIIALACDELEIVKHTQFMIHNYSGGAGGKGHEIKARIEFSDAELNKAFSILYKDFLSPSEMASVIAGSDMWMNSKNVSKRWKKVLKGRNANITV